MKFSFSSFVWLLGVRYGLSRKHSRLVSFISRLSIIGLVVSVALLILVMSIMNGFDRELRNNILSIMPHASVYHQQGIENTQDIIKSVESNPHVISSSPFVQLEALVSRKKSVVPILLFGIDPALEGRTSSVPDKLPADVMEKLANQENQIILGQGVAKKLNVQVNDKVTLIIPATNNLNGDEFSPRVKIMTVCAVLNSQSELDNNLALMEIKQASAISLHPGKITGVRLKLDDLFQAQSILHEVVDELPMGYYGFSWMRTHGPLYEAIQMSKNMIGILLFLIISIAAFNLVSTLIMVVVDKQGDIAILRTMGASTKEIMSIFVLHGGLIGVIGTTIGSIIGIGLSLVVTPLVEWIEKIFGIQFLKSDVYPVSYLPSDLQWENVLHVVLTAMLISFVVVIYPAWRASRIQPADALRYE
jgi:lipoprotein-releasing system permease protein